MPRRARSANCGNASRPIVKVPSGQFERDVGDGDARVHARSVSESPRRAGRSRRGRNLEAAATHASRATRATRRDRAGSGRSVGAAAGRRRSAGSRRSGSRGCPPPSTGRAAGAAASGRARPAAPRRPSTRRSPRTGRVTRPPSRPRVASTPGAVDDGISSARSASGSQTHVPARSRAVASTSCVSRRKSAATALRGSADGLLQPAALRQPGVIPRHCRTSPARPVDTSGSSLRTASPWSRAASGCASAPGPGTVAARRPGRPGR